MCVQYEDIRALFAIVIMPRGREYGGFPERRPPQSRHRYEDRGSGGGGSGYYDQPEERFDPEYDARRYVVSVDNDEGSKRSKDRSKHKKQKHKSHKRKRSKERPPVAEEPRKPKRKPLVDYEAVSEASEGEYSSPSPPPPSRVTTDHDKRGRRPKSPATALEAYKMDMFARSHSNSPVIRDKERDVRDKEKYIEKYVERRNKTLNRPPSPPPEPPPKAYAPKAYADPPKAYNTNRSPSPRSPSPKRRRSPSPYQRGRHHSRSRSPPGRYG